MQATSGASILEQPVRFLKGVGPRRAELLARLGVQTVADLLHYYPRRHEDRRNLCPIRRLKAGLVQTIEGEVLAMGGRRSRRGIYVFELAIGDTSGVIQAVWFRQPYLRNAFKVGDRLILHGKVTLYKKLTLVSPEYEKIEEGEEAQTQIHTHRIVPVYGLTESLGQRFMRGLLYRASQEHAASIPEIFPEDLRRRLDLDSIDRSLSGIHFPQTPEENERARRRLIFEEFFLLQLALSIRRQAALAAGGLAHAVEGNLVRRFDDLLPFEWTDDQKQATAEIERDMASGRPMNRLLQGEVGSGKTLVALRALVLTIQNGHQGALMAPTEILAQQHFLTAKAVLEPLGIEPALLLAGQPAEEKSRLAKKAAEGGVQLLIGTHALIQKSVSFARLGLAVIDEQHKFGVDQRAQLQKKGGSAHVLVLTATPIPRTLALTVYGDLDVSTMRHKPGARLPVQTVWVEEDKRDRVYQFLEDELAQGHQAYIVYPVIKGSAKLALKSASDMFERLSRGPFSHRRCGLLHGQLKPQEKESLMESFRKGDTQLLVATSMVEVGLDVPNATAMVVEEAHRFGLAQLHQLRGRIGRGEAPSTCVLLSHAPTEAAKERLEALEQMNDGFEIAEKDLALRGPGEFFGTEQSGLLALRIGDLTRDLELLKLARVEADGLVRSDPQMTHPEHALLHAVLRRRYPSVAL